MSGPFSINDIQELLEILKNNDVSEFKLDRGEERLWLKRGEQANYARQQQVYVTQPMQMSTQTVPVQRVEEQGAANQTASSQTGGQVTGTAANGSTAAASVAASKNIKEILSPMVGTFYRRPAVDAEPYVEVGDSIKKGDVLCIIEAMKVMNEIESEMTGKVIEVCLEDGQMVEYGEVVYRVETNA